MGIRETITLLSNVAAAGDGPNVSISRGGSYLYMVTGTFGGTSSQLQILGPDGVTFVPHGAAIAANGQARVDIPSGATVRTVLTGGAPTGMYASLGLVQSAG